MSTAIAIQRTPELIAAEINHIKAETRFMLLNNSIEIGRRLCEAKQFIPHGEWGKWLDSSVDYSQSTANNLMRIFNEYGAEQLTLFGETGLKSQAFGNLSYSQAVALLALPSDEREQFITENDVDNMSTRELQQAIKERDQARQELEEKAEEARKFEEGKQTAEAALQQEKEKSQKEIAKLTQTIENTKKQLAEAQASDDNDVAERLQESLEKTDAELCEAQKRIEELEQQLKEKPIDVPATSVVEKIPEEVEQELAELRKQKKSTVAVKYSMHFSNLVKDFQDLLGSLAEIEQEDPQEGERYRHATLELISKMSARL